MLRKGYYPTKGGYFARLDSDITKDRQLGIIDGIGFVAFNLDGTFSYKDEHYVGDNLDLVVDQWTPLDAQSGGNHGTIINAD